MSKNSWLEILRASLFEQGLETFGAQPVSPPVSIEFYKEWIRQGHHAEMTYLKNHVPQKSDVKTLLASASTLISVAAPYTPHPKPVELPLKALKVARYAQGEDYHHWFRLKLESAAKVLRDQFPDHEFLCFTDSNPLLEKEWAARGHLGWIGKNSLLLNQRQGSLFFLGEIVTSLKLDDAPVKFEVPDFCGKCTACIDHCPTGAILENRSLDARKCLAFWNIEAKSAPPPELRDQFQGWIFGCDICQEVCPWNQKVFRQVEPTPVFDHSQVIEDLRYILRSSNRRLQRDFGATPIRRAGGKGLKRTALCIVGGWKLQELKPDLLELRFDDEPLESLREWALEQIKTSECTSS